MPDFCTFCNCVGHNIEKCMRMRSKDHEGQPKDDTIARRNDKEFGKATDRQQ